jgi:D-beta-D-heptose 7-phosphate kinase/D-beta-D-heptose 1-phosphate adenosyltransferase
LGAQPTLIGVVGHDAWADSLSAQFSTTSGVVARLVQDPSRQTTVKTRFIAEGQQVLRADRETRRPLSPDLEIRVLAEYRSVLSSIDIVILSDYGKGVLSDAVIGAAIAEAKAAGKFVIVDPKNKDFTKYRGTTVLTPNRHELQAACGFECDTDEQVALGAQRILEQGVCDQLVVTRGKDGMSIIPSGGAAVHLRTTAREVFDVSGAGDTVAATMALSLAAGAGIHDACILANVAAGIVVSKRGTAIVTTSEIATALSPFDGSVEQHKMFSLDSVVRLAHDWQAQGLKVAFTNGCFDLLHPGHIALLDQARRTADRLIVGLNADVSVRNLKGIGRPVQGEISRATVLASLKSVDAVVIFTEDTPLRLIEALRPDVLVKGADYALHEVVGGDLVTQRGGKVVLAQLVTGHSTSDTVQRLRTTASQ